MPTYRITTLDEIESGDKPLDIYLTEGPGGAVELRCKADGGRPYYLVTIKPEGRIYRHVSVPKEFGFDLDRSGRVKIHGDEEF